MEQLDNTIILYDEDGEECLFELLDLVEFEGKEYIVLLPLDDDEDEGEVVILAVEGLLEEDPGIESYESIEDERVLMKVFEIFKDKFRDQFDFAVR